jgi:hypothetical protein
VIIAGCSYVADCLTYYFFPDYARIVALISTLPQAAGEMGFTGWMLIKGVRTEHVDDQPSGHRAAVAA